VDVIISSCVGLLLSRDALENLKFSLEKMFIFKCLDLVLKSLVIFNQ
jgi:hypothetical protein